MGTDSLRHDAFEPIAQARLNGAAPLAPSALLEKRDAGGARGEA
jgi:hypothetical protein